MKAVLLFLVIATVVTAAQVPGAGVAEGVATEVSASTVSCQTSDPKLTHECLLRETARLFLAAGKPQAALRLLCNSTTAQETFRPGGSLRLPSNGGLSENEEGIKRCLAAVGLQ